MYSIIHYYFGAKDDTVWKNVDEKSYRGVGLTKSWMATYCFCFPFYVSTTINVIKLYLNYSKIYFNKHK